MAVSSFVKKRTKIEVTGIVQGVGFRPFVYRHALLHSLSGYTLNNGGGVLIEVEGEELHISKFLETLKNAAPTLSRVDTLVSEEVPLKDSDGFTILESQTRTLNTMIPVDISICSDCQKEMQDPQNRRYQHPFINCLNCGPRYSVIDSLPYDRKNTSMQTFDMCDECRSEYEEPSSRRFHAQAISCPKCGPKLSEDISIKIFAQLIKEGKLAAIKGIGGFHILCDASNSVAVKELRVHKHRPKKPLAVMFKNLASIKEACSLSREEEVLILSRERPIVLVRKKKNSLIAESVAPNIDKIGVFLAYTPLHELLLNELDCPIVATSANVSGEPIIRDEKELLNRLPFVTQSVLTHDREILNSCDDSVVMSVEGESVMLRLGRGYAPKSFYRAKKITKKILALGANQKSTITMAFDNHLILSPHIGDLNSIEAFEYFVRTLETFKRFYSFEPDIIVCDKHPGYETTKWAKDYVAKNPNIELLEVQHHYAHALACMAEHDLEGEALAFCFDGTGYGENEEGNASLWGGEVLRVTPREYKREYHLGEFSLLGGEKATGEPRRVALGLLFECYSLEEILVMKNELVNSFTQEEITTYHLMCQKGINSPKSSSIGRLFDGVYALSGNLNKLAYEGESGLIIETSAHAKHSNDSYSYSLKEDIIEYKEMIKEIVDEKEKTKIASKFLNTLTNIIVDISKKHSNLPIILSGGVFQNATLLSKVIKAFKVNDIRYYIQNQTPINDGGISLGQVYYALHKKRGEDG